MNDTYKVVAGPSAASWAAELLPLASPTNDVSTRLSSGPATHSAKQGSAKLRYCASVGWGGGADSPTTLPPRSLVVDVDVRPWVRLVVVFFVVTGSIAAPRAIRAMAKDNDD